MLSYSAEGVSVGSSFIASIEANVKQEYKQAFIGHNDEILPAKKCIVLRLTKY